MIKVLMSLGFWVFSENILLGHGQGWPHVLGEPLVAPTYGEYLAVGVRSAGSKGERPSKAVTEQDPSDDEANDGRRYGKRRMQKTPPPSGRLEAAVPDASPPQLILDGRSPSAPFSPISLGMSVLYQATPLPVWQAPPPPLPAATHAMPERVDSPFSRGGSPVYDSAWDNAFLAGICHADDEGSSDEDAPPPGIIITAPPPGLTAALTAVEAAVRGLSIDTSLPSTPAPPAPSSRKTGVLNF